MLIQGGEESGKCRAVLSTGGNHSDTDSEDDEDDDLGPADGSAEGRSGGSGSGETSSANKAAGVSKKRDLSESDRAALAELIAQSLLTRAQGMRAEARGNT